MVKQLDDRKVFNMRIPVYLRGALREAAARRGTSQNELLSEALANGIDAYGNGRQEVPTEFAYTCMRIPHDVYDKVREISLHEFTSVTGIATLFLRDYLEGEKCAATEVEGE